MPLQPTLYVMLMMGITLSPGSSPGLSISDAGVPSPTTRSAKKNFTADRLLVANRVGHRCMQTDQTAAACGTAGLLFMPRGAKHMNVQGVAHRSHHSQPELVAAGPPVSALHCRGLEQRRHEVWLRWRPAAAVYLPDALRPRSASSVAAHQQGQHGELASFPSAGRRCEWFPHVVLRLPL